MGMTTLGNDLNGYEIREMIKKEFAKWVDELPYLRMGNTFAMAEADVAVVMSAQPSDIPVPNAEGKIRILASSVRMIPNDKTGEIEYYYKLNPDNVIVEEYESGVVAGNQPDKARIEHNLPVRVTKDAEDGSGKIDAEVKVGEGMEVKG